MIQLFGEDEMRLTIEGVSNEYWQRLSEHREILSTVNRHMWDRRDRAKREGRKSLGNPRYC